MKNMRIRPRLLISFMVIVLLVVIAGGYGIFAITSASHDTQLLNARATSAILSGNLETNLNLQRALGRDTALAAPLVWNVPSIFEDNVRQLAEADTEFNAVVTQLNDLLVTEESRAILSDVISNYREFQAGCDNLIMVLGDNSSTPEQVVAALDASTKPYDGAVASIQKLSDFFDRMTDEQASAAANHAGLTTSVLIVGIIIAMAIAIILSLYIAGIISTPVNIMSSLLKQAGETGNLMFTDGELQRAREVMVFRDEISQSVAVFVKLIENLIYCGTALEAVANRDLTANVNLLSDTDTIGLSLQKMIENLNNMFEEINASSGQVSIGSKQIADGAQSLAQGATEQASSIEELSASIGEIAEQTKQNANIAKEAAALSGAIRSNAEKGSTQMDQMMQAVREINEASNQISKVIKVIDDIAFQTNILALNAAVEAARAGQHGRGFAVVAEEVRNLAAKSAEAAKDTGGLIENSIEKANFGLNIAAETSASLKEIVDGINHNAEIVAQIASSSNEQAGAIAQINTGIDQVAQVVQQNSATAEESAAASEEMSGQSDMLAQLISQFKLKDTDYSPSPSSLSEPHKKTLTMPEKSAFSLTDNHGAEYGKY